MGQVAKRDKYGAGGKHRFSRQQKTAGVPRRFFVVKVV